MPFFNDHHERRVERQQDTIERQRDTIERQRDILRDQSQSQYEPRDIQYQHELRDYQGQRDFGDMQRSSSPMMESGEHPVFHPSRPNTRIIMSPGRGAGWVSDAPRGASDAFLVWMLTYEPLIRALERGAKKDKIEDIVEDFHKEARRKCGFEVKGIAKGGDLTLVEVSYAFEIREVDGCEKLERAAPEFGRRRNIRIEEGRW